MSSTPRVLYCGTEDSLYKKLVRLLDDFVLEARKILFQGTPQGLAHSRNADVLILKTNGDLDSKTKEWLSKNDSSVPVIILCRNGNIDTAIQSFQYGIYDYFCTRDMEMMAQQIREAMVWKNTRAVKRPSASDFQFLLGKTPDIVQVNEKAKYLAGEHTPVILVGEPGTGKEHLARAIHKTSGQKSEAFLRCDCRLLQQTTLNGGFPLPELIRLRIHGSEKNRGSLMFLDHIEDVSTEQRNEILDTAGKSSARVIASYQENRLDFFEEAASHRISTLRIPPLRQRKEDIPLIADYFLRKAVHARQTRTKGLTDEVILLLQEYPWPGNIQELAGLMDRMVLLEPSHLITAATWRTCQGHSSKMHLDSNNQFAALLESVLKGSEQEWKNGTVYNGFVNCMEKLLIDLVLPRVDNNQAVAARILGISRNTLRRHRKTSVA